MNSGTKNEFMQNINIKNYKEAKSKNLFQSGEWVAYISGTHIHHSFIKSEVLDKIEEMKIENPILTGECFLFQVGKEHFCIYEF